VSGDGITNAETARAVIADRSAADSRHFNFDSAVDEVKRLVAERGDTPASDFIVPTREAARLSEFSNQFYRLPRLGDADAVLDGVAFDIVVPVVACVLGVVLGSMVGNLATRLRR